MTMANCRAFSLYGSPPESPLPWDSPGLPHYLGERQLRKPWAITSEFTGLISTPREGEADN